MTIRISLQDELEKQIREEVESGHYSSASEVVREALRNFFAKPAEVLDDEVLAYWLTPRIEALTRGTAQVREYDPNRMADHRKKIIKRLQGK